ncbi:hypothetical protein GCM10022378_15470 [Salinicoccus jeotgali]|uniref:DUF3021 domain-containing protein n=2 Tax=Salinicoccus jeotgali TaxID=381634 RepID=A0ABP7EXI7_9STAP
MMLTNIIKNVSVAVGLGSFIYLLNGISGSVEVLHPQEIISVWIASMMIGFASMLHYTNLSQLFVTLIQLAVGITSFTIIALFNGRIALTSVDILSFASLTLIIMLIIYTVSYIIVLIESKKINNKLGNK